MRLVVARPRNRCRARANATIVPSTVATRVASRPILRLLPRAGQTSGAPHGFFQLSSVKPCQAMLDLPESLKEKTSV